MISPILSISTEMKTATDIKRIKTSYLKQKKIVRLLICRNNLQNVNQNTYSLIHIKEKKRGKKERGECMQTWTCMETHVNWTNTYELNANILKYLKKIKRNTKKFYLTCCNRFLMRVKCQRLGRIPAGQNTLTV